MPPVTSRDFMKVAAQRLTEAETLLRVGLTLTAQREGGYAVETALKARILLATADADEAAMLARITRGSAMHRPEVLLAVLRDLGIELPASLTPRMRQVERSRTIDLRYETGRRDTGETTALLKTARAVYDWVEGQLP